MYKLYPKAIFILLIMFTSGLVNACSCSTDKNRPLAELSILTSGKEENCEQPERHCEPVKQMWQSIFGDPSHSLSSRSELLPPHPHRGQKTILSKRSNKPTLNPNLSTIPQEDGPSQLPPTVEKLDPKEAAKKRRLQENVKKEIIGTERNYNLSLHVLKDFFLTPLQEKFKDNAEIQKFTSKFQVLLEPLLTTSDTLLQALESKKKPDGSITNTDLGNVFINTSISSFTAFNNFAASYTDLLNQSIALSKANPALQIFFQEQATKPTLKYLGFDAYLIVPIQRPPRYQMMLETLLKHISEKDDGYATITKTLAQIKNSTQAVNANTPKTDLSKLPENVAIRSMDKPGSHKEKVGGVKKIFKGLVAKKINKS